MPETKEPKPKSPIQILISRVDNIRNDAALLRNRVENVEKSVVTLKDYFKDQLVELYSQIEAARETMDEITSFFEEMNKDGEEDEHDFAIEQGLDVQEDDEDGYPEDETEDENQFIPSDSDGLELELYTEEEDQ